MKKERHELRVRQFLREETGAQLGRDALPGLWIEQLQYMNVLREEEVTHKLQRTNGEPVDVVEQRITFLPPAYVKSSSTAEWCRSQAARMRSFGIAAWSCPASERWPDAALALSLKAALA